MDIFWNHTFCHVNDSRWGNPPSQGRVHVTVNCLWRRLCVFKSDSKKPQHWNVAVRADNERKRTLTTKMRHSPAIFSVYMPSDHATTFSNVTLGLRGCKFVCKRGPFCRPRLSELPHLPGVPYLHANRPLQGFIYGSKLYQDWTNMLFRAQPDIGKLSF